MNARTDDFIKVYKKRYIRWSGLGPRFATFIKVEPNELAKKCFRDGNLYRCQIQTSSGLSIGRAFNFQLNRVRNRWNVGIKRTTGFVLLDTVWVIILGALTAVKELIRLVFGTRVKLRDLTNGAEFMSRTVEQQKDTETMIFASLAAILEAARFVEEGSAEVEYLEKSYMKEVSGLTFAGGMIGTMGMEEEDEDDASEEFDEMDIEIDEELYLEV